VHRSVPAGIADPGFAVDSIEWALLEAIRCQHRIDAIVSLDSALNQRLISMPSALALFDHLPRQYSAYAHQIDPAAQSGLETKARLGLRRFRVALRTQARIAGVGRVDLLVGDRLVLELDGYRWHSTQEAFEEDRRRDLELIKRGYLVVRLSYDQVMNQWESVVSVIRDLVSRREHRWAARHVRAGLAAGASEKVTWGLEEAE
jgi:very-short-patch-repair endonuclease